MNPEAILKQLETTKEYVSPAELAVLYIGLGDKEQSLSALERAYTAHNLQMAFLGIDLHVDPLRSETSAWQCGTVNRDRWVLGTVGMTVDRFRFGSNGT